MTVNNIMDQIRKNRELLNTVAKPQLTAFEDIKYWWEQMPDVQREPYYTMSWLVDTLGYPSNMIGPVLCQLGWQRRRSWRRDRPFSRIWVPPTQNNETGDEL